VAGEDVMKVMLRSLALLAVLGLAVPPAARAHGGHDHVMGTVKAVDLKAGTIEVETRDGTRVTVLVNDKTKYLRGTAAAAASDVVVDLRVVVDAGKEGGKVVAREIRLAPSGGSRRK
jgi:hypothetical protein